VAALSRVEASAAASEETLRAALAAKTLDASQTEALIRNELRRLSSCVDSLTQVFNIINQVIDFIFESGNFKGFFPITCLITIFILL